MNKFKVIAKTLLVIICLIGSKVSNAQCYLSSIPSYGTPLNTTGSQKLDAILVNEHFLLQNAFGTQVILYAFEDGQNPNALAVPQYSSILLGKTLLLDELVSTNGANSIKAIMAHEFAHIVQHKYNLNGNGTWDGKWMELHADYLAGWYIGKMHYLETSELVKIGRSFYEKGDFNYYSSQHHGTPAERTCSFGKGYKDGAAQLDLFTAYTNGVNFIASNNICPMLNETNQNNSTSNYSNNSTPGSSNNSNGDYNTNSSNNSNNTYTKMSAKGPKGKLLMYTKNKKKKKISIYIVEDGNYYLLYDAKNVWPKNENPAFGDDGTLSIELPEGKFLFYYKDGSSKAAYNFKEAAWPTITISAGQTTTYEFFKDE